MSDRTFGQVCFSDVVGPGEYARVVFVLARRVRLDEFRFEDDVRRPFNFARVKVNGECPSIFFKTFKLAQVVPVSTNSGGTDVPFILKPGDVLVVESVNSSGRPAKLTCSLVGCEKEVP